MRRALGIVMVLACLQAAAWGVWRSRAREEVPFTVEAASGAAPAIAPRDGLLHVWATWCAPCREELPGLIAAARAAGVPLVAASVDRNPGSVAAFFGGAVPAEVVRDPDVADAIGVRALPVTLRVRGGALVERVDGARDWSSAAARAWLTR